ncbi:MAG: PaaI family thioesterase [Hyphomonadaceae bacterium]|nr:PaaI family thioesterase [Hyphomonadaceae bacterium]
MTGEAPPVADAVLLARFQESVNQPRGSRLLGFTLIALSQADRRVEALFDAKPDFANPMRQVQGGYLCAMLDDVMSVACLVSSGMTHVAPTLEMKTSFLRPALADGRKLRAVGRVVKWGRTIAFTEGELWDGDETLLAKATGTAMPTPFKNFK